VHLGKAAHKGAGGAVEPLRQLADGTMSLPEVRVWFFVLFCLACLLGSGSFHSVERRPQVRVLPSDSGLHICL
jgi:hypothetical protein